MEESAENYSLQIASERFTNLAEKGEIRGQVAFLKVALNYFCYAGLSREILPSYQGLLTFILGQPLKLSLSVQCREVVLTVDVHLRCCHRDR